MDSSIKINNIEYKILDSKEKITVADSFVINQNKIGSANGEAKLYIGNDNNELRTFFGKKGFTINCVILKADLLQYLRDCKNEYKKPSQDYRGKSNMSSSWDKKFADVNKLNDNIFFSLTEQTQITPPRIYVKSDHLAYQLIRQISLPNITYLSCIKLEHKNDNPLYYFRLFTDFFGESAPPQIIEEELEEINNKNLTEKKKLNLTQSRIGQGKYREKLLSECPFCPITMITDDRLLIASHIKPWVDSNEKEKIDPKNGFMFTPTIDLLFDRGFITFSNNKEMLISPWLSKITCSKLNLTQNKKYPMLPISGREKYLDHHRKHIFKN